MRWTQCWTVAVVAGWVVLGVSCGRIPAASDAREAQEIARELQSRSGFRVAESPDSKRPAVYAKPHPDYTILDVYGPFTPAERSQIITLVMQIRADKGSKPIHVHFYPRHLDQTELVHQEVIP